MLADSHDANSAPKHSFMIDSSSNFSKSFIRNKDRTSSLNYIAESLQSFLGPLLSHVNSIRCSTVWNDFLISKSRRIPVEVFSCKYWRRSWQNWRYSCSNWWTIHRSDSTHLIRQTTGGLSLVCEMTCHDYLQWHNADIHWQKTWPPIEHNYFLHCFPRPSLSEERRLFPILNLLRYAIYRLFEILLSHVA